jgi:hypothetical protein
MDKNIKIQKFNKNNKSDSLKLLSIILNENNNFSIHKYMKDYNDTIFDIPKNKNNFNSKLFDIYRILNNMIKYPEKRKLIGFDEYSFHIYNIYFSENNEFIFLEEWTLELNNQQKAYINGESEPYTIDDWSKDLIKKSNGTLYKAKDGLLKYYDKK